MTLTVEGQNLDFDCSNPEHLARYQAALVHLKKVDISQIAKMGENRSDAQALRAYIELLNETVVHFMAYLTEMFGEEAATKLIGDNRSLTRVIDVQEAIFEAIAEQQTAIERRFAQYAPNRNVKE